MVEEERDDALSAKSDMIPCTDAGPECDLSADLRELFQSFSENSFWPNEEERLEDIKRKICMSPIEAVRVFYSPPQHAQDFFKVNRVVRLGSQSRLGSNAIAGVFCV